MKRQLTIQQMDAVFCCTDFIRRVEESGKSTTQILQEASTDDFDRWLREGEQILKEARKRLKEGRRFL